MKIQSWIILKTIKEAKEECLVSLQYHFRICQWEQVKSDRKTMTSRWSNEGNKILYCWKRRMKYQWSGVLLPKSRRNRLHNLMQIQFQIQYAMYLFIKLPILYKNSKKAKCKGSITQLIHLCQSSNSGPLVSTLTCYAWKLMLQTRWRVLIGHD